MIVDFTPLYDIALLALRIMVGIIFFYYGKMHVIDPATWGERIGYSKAFTFALGVVEIAAAISVALGIFIQIGAALLVVVMVGAIFNKAFLWNKKFFGAESPGWHYDALLLCANLLFLAEGGRLIILG